MTETSSMLTQLLNSHNELDSDTKQIYSRQLNKTTMTENELLKVFNMRTLLIGVSSICSEIVKNLIRNGSKTIFVFDESPVEVRDIRNNFFFEQSDIGLRKDEALKKHNPTLQVLTLEKLEQSNVQQLNFDSIVVTKILPWEQIVEYNKLANDLSIPFVFSGQLGMSFFIFSDFGKTKSFIQGEDEIQQLPIQRYFSDETSIDQMFYLSTYNERHMETFTLLQTVFEYLKEFGQLPQLYCQKDSDQFFSKLNEIASKIDLDFTDEKDIYLKFAQTSRIEIPLVAEISGALTSCEILKSVLTRLIPANQVLFWENFAFLQTIKSINHSDIEHFNPQFIDQQLLFGKDMMKQISNLKILLVGCGAVGCEQVKNLYQMGACNGESGHLYLVDDDLIERSNLPRQVLFTSKDVNKNKAVSCKNWILSKDPSVNVTTFDILIREQSEHIFNHDFFENIDIIIVAVDSVQSRHYLADKAIKHKKFLIESATYGFEAQSQSQVPYFSKKISIANQQEISTASCTLKSALKNIGDALICAKTVFTEEFSCIRQVDGTYLSDEKIKYFANLYSTENNNLDLCDQELMKHVEFIFNEMYHNEVIKLGDTYNPFNYDKSNLDHKEFVENLFQMLRNSFTNYKPNSTPTEVIEGKKVLPSFDKDNIIHGNIVYQLSKLKSQVFNIPFNLERYDAIGRIGNIVPAILQSTSVASGFALIELFTWIQHKEEIFKLYQQILKQNETLRVTNQQQQEEEEEAKTQDSQSKEIILQGHSTQQAQAEQIQKRIDLFLSEEIISELKNKFDEFGFKETFGLVSSPITLSRSYGQFEIGFLNLFNLKVSSNTLLSELVVSINSLLHSRNLPSIFQIDVEKERIYLEDYLTSTLLAKPLKPKLQEYLNFNLKRIIEPLLKHANTDSIFTLVIYSFKINPIGNKAKGERIAEITLTVEQ